MRKTLRVFYNTLKTLSFTKLLRILKLCLPNPLLTILATYATLRSFVLAQKFFPKTSSTNGVGNAFRHALWCCLIMMYCCKITSPEKALSFCKKLTDLHEELFPNEPLERQMDLHNNEIGMQLFMELLPGIHRQFFESSFFIEKLLVKIKTAKILSDPGGDYSGNLVYLKK
ncbi:MULTISPECIES: DUF6973 domain-containing protein [Kaistella]|uniref:DUF6973 domain-containing protein n=1 Tax=Kaistella pullorum TaxID=2763074 RepID=A0ABR8WKA1_9FLAO|nr:MULTISPECIES: hypothetical protein [Kaistella]MBD8017415.1 hypothetical protein [Kaistella pullorum]